MVNFLQRLVYFIALILVTVYVISANPMNRRRLERGTENGKKFISSNEKAEMSRELTHTSDSFEPIRVLHVQPNKNTEAKTESIKSREMKHPKVKNIHVSVRLVAPTIDEKSFDPFDTMSQTTPLNSK